MIASPARLRFRLRLRSLYQGGFHTATFSTTEGARQTTTGGSQDAFALKLMNLRARWYSAGSGTFTSVDPFAGIPKQPYSLHSYQYSYSDPIMNADPSGLVVAASGGAPPPTNSGVACPLLASPNHKWDCEAVRNIGSLRDAFLDSAARHNKIPSMDNNGFAALIASILVQERRIGNVPPDGDSRDRASQQKEDLVAELGCIISGSYIEDAWDKRDWGRLFRYLNNQEIPEGPQIRTLASVGIGNMKLLTAANLWKGMACDGVDGTCTPVQISKLQVKNVFGFNVDLENPYSSQVGCALGACGLSAPPSETESYMRISHQLQSQAMAIEYAAANLEAAASRANSKGLQPSAFNAASWHFRGLQTDDEISRGNWPPGAAIRTLDEISFALTSLGVSSSWSVSSEPQYQKYTNSP